LIRQSQTSPFVQRFLKEYTGGSEHVDRAAETVFARPTVKSAAPVAMANEDRITVRHTTPAKPSRNHIEQRLINHDIAFAPALAVPKAHATRVETSHSGSALKEALIREQLLDTQPTGPQLSKRQQRKRQEKAAKQLRKRRRFTPATILSFGLAVAVLAGYLTYANLPSISVRIAASKAGVDAKAPFMPNGYSINGPVAYSPGIVTINYRANGGGNG
jgi:hypothetical protein